MSAKLERRSRLRKKSEEHEISIKQSRSITSANDQKRKLLSSSVTNFDSDTFSSSSPSKVDINSQKKFHKKKIRSTQDFNQLNNSLTSQDSDESTKNKPKRTKKSKKAYKLPRISQMAIDFAADAQNIFSDDELVRKKRRKGKVESDSDVLLEGNCQAQRKKGNKIEQNNTEMLLDFNKESDEKNSITEEYKSATSIADSDDEIVFKCKTKLQKRQKKRIESNVAESEILNINSRSNNTTKSCLSTPSSNKKWEQNKKPSMKTTKCETTPKLDRSSVHSYNQGDITKQSISSKPLLRVSCTPYPKNKLSNTPLVDYKKRVTRSIMRQSRIDLSEEFSPEVEIKVKNRKSNGLASLTASIDFEMDFDCDDVFDETLKKSDEENTAGNQKRHWEDATITNKKIGIKPRKSVRFQSPEPNIRRETIILSKTTLNKMTVEPNDCDTLTQSIVEDHRPSNGSIRRNSTFEITSPVVSQGNLPDVSQNRASFNKSLNKSGNSSNTIRKSSNEPIKRSSTFEITSPVTNQVNIPDVSQNNIFDQSLNKRSTISNKIHKSSNEPIKRSSTFEITSPVTNQVNLPDVSQNKISIDQSLNKRSTSSNIICKSSNEPIKRSSTFEITSPVTNQVNHPDVSQNKILIDQSLNKRSASSNKIRKSSNQPIKRSSTVEITSPITNQVNLADVSQNKISLHQTLNERNISSSNKNLRRTRLQENSIIDLTTPTPLKKVNSVFASSCETFNISGIGSLDKLHKQSTFSIDDEAPAVHMESPYAADNNETIANASGAPSLVRTATFTKEDENVEHSRDLQSDLIYSPLPSDTSYSKLIDTSKVNKRRRWDKSRLSVSFLSDSLDIGNISAPWQEDDSILARNTSKANEQKHSMDLKFSPNINNSHTNKVTFRNTPTSVSATSTPYAKSKSTLLKQALLRDNRNVTINESKNRTVLNEKPLPKVTRTKIPNFARIHQRALDKLENIKEMSERKAARAKLLLSGHKPPTETSQKPSSKRKELKFSPDKLKSSANKDKNTKRNLLTSHISVTKIKAISPSKSNPKVTNKENKLTPVEKKKDALKTKSLQPKPKVPKAVVAGKNGYTRFGFKMGPEGVKKATRDEQVKAVASKSKIMKNTIEERRNIIQGVRSNRRFELLMNMRMK